MQRKHIVIVGRTNAGKSTLFNALTEQKNAIVSPHAGTTTDPVIKTAELIPFGPVVFIDTAGFGDETKLGKERAEKTAAVLRRADMIIYVANCNAFDEDDYRNLTKGKAGHLLVFNQCQQEQIKGLTSKYPDAIFLTDINDSELNILRERISKILESLEEPERAALVDLLSPGDTVVLVVPIDSEAPKGRLILPQVQAIRQCLDAGAKSIVIGVEELKEVVATYDPTLVVTDSQAFAEVAEIVPEEVPLTSFSMLLAYDKSDFKQLLTGCQEVNKLPDGGKILVLEGCTHNKGHEDIGYVKIPALLAKKTKKDFSFRFCSGYDFPDDIATYDMVIQCGNCMINSREVKTRLEILKEQDIPVTNYGMILAYLNGILDRSAKVFERIIQ